MNTHLKRSAPTRSSSSVYPRVLSYLLPRATQWPSVFRIVGSPSHTQPRENPPPIQSSSVPFLLIVENARTKGPSVCGRGLVLFFFFFFLPSPRLVLGLVTIRKRNSQHPVSLPLSFPSVFHLSPISPELEILSLPLDSNKSILPTTSYYFHHIRRTHLSPPHSPLLHSPPAFALFCHQVPSSSHLITHLGPQPQPPPPLLLRTQTSRPHL